MPAGFVRIERIDRRNRGLRTVVLSDGRELEVSADAFRRSGLAEGMAAAERAIQELCENDQADRVHKTALRLLSHRARSESELRRRLRERGFGGPAIEAETHRLREVGLLDDRAFASAFVEERTRHSPRGKRLLRQELAVRGVERAIAAELMESVDDDSLALELARKRLIRTSANDYETFQAQTGPYLQRRGFSYDAARRAMVEAWGERHSGYERQSNSLTGR